MFSYTLYQSSNTVHTKNIDSIKILGLRIRTAANLYNKDNREDLRS